MSYFYSKYQRKLNERDRYKILKLKREFNECIDYLKKIKANIKSDNIQYRHL